MKSNEFKAARKAAKLRIVDLSARSNVSKPTIILIERGKCKSLTSLEKVAKALNKKLSIHLID
jgi:transcriptional regulator with XRE-family HTH domain